MPLKGAVEYLSPGSLGERKKWAGCVQTRLSEKNRDDARATIERTGRGPQRQTLPRAV